MQCENSEAAAPRSSARSMCSLDAAALLSAAEMRDAEAQAIAAGTSGSVLMERAGAAVVVALEAFWPDLAPGARACILCGPGGNGGDGYVVARLLHMRGWRVRVHALAPATTPDARAQAEKWAATGVTEGWDEAAA